MQLVDAIRKTGEIVQAIMALVMFIVVLLLHVLLVPFYALFV